MNGIQLRPSQKEILTYRNGKMAVSAVPGSGKTFTLSHLAATLIGEQVTGDGQEVLVVTFSNSAVDNFTHRIATIIREKGWLPGGYRVRTLHGLAHDIISMRPDLAGLPEHFQILDDRDTNEILQKVVDTWLAANRRFMLDWTDPAIDLTTNLSARKDWLQLIREIASAFIHQAKDLQVFPKDIKKLLQPLQTPQPLIEMGLEMYTEYQRSLNYRSAVDFDDLIRLALEVMNADKDLLESLRFKWPYVLEDEAQDSSRLQEEILKLLVGDEGNWVRVGDPNQAIYESFTTSNPLFLQAFMKRGDVKTLPLPNSGRSTESIVDLANWLNRWTRQQHPVEDLRPALTLPEIRPTDPGDPQPNPANVSGGIKLIQTRYQPGEEIRDVAKSIKKFLQDHPDWTVAALVPTNHRGNELSEALKKSGIQPIELLQSTHTTREMAEVLSKVLEALEDPDSPAKLKDAYLKIREKDSRGDDGELPGWVNDTAEWIKKCRNLEEYLWPTPEKNWLDTLPQDDGLGQVLTELEGFREQMTRWHQATSLPIDQLILTLAGDLFHQPNELALSHKLAAMLERAAAVHPDWGLDAFILELNRVVRNERRLIGFGEEESGFIPEKYPGRIVVTTMHKAKGLEWDRVYLLSVNTYDFPSVQPGDHYRSDKWYVQGRLNLVAETIEKLKALVQQDVLGLYLAFGAATEQERIRYSAERLRLLYVGITRARKELIITWNTGRRDDCSAALPLKALWSHLEDPTHAISGNFSVQPE